MLVPNLLTAPKGHLIKIRRSIHWLVWIHVILVIGIRPCLHVSEFVCIRRHFIAVTKLYVSTRIRICCVFDRLHVCESDPNSILECSNRLLSMRWWINWDDYHSNALSGWAISTLLRHHFQNVSVTCVHAQPDSLRFQKFPLGQRVETTKRDR